MKKDTVGLSTILLKTFIRRNLTLKWSKKTKIIKYANISEKQLFLYIGCFYSLKLSWGMLQSSDIIAFCVFRYVRGSKSSDDKETCLLLLAAILFKSDNCVWHSAIFILYEKANEQGSSSQRKWLFLQKPRPAKLNSVRQLNCWNIEAANWGVVW